MEIRQRQTAYKVKVSDILNGRYVVQNGWDPNYITVDGNKVSRVNVIGVIVSKQSSEMSKNDIMVLDDGSGRVSLRSFEEIDFSKIRVGDVVVLIGRPREYGGEIYVMPEVINSLPNKKWVDVRRMELRMMRAADGKESIKESEEPAGRKEEKLEKVETEEILYDDAESEGDSVNAGPQGKKEDELSPAEKVMKYIKDLDDGNGADVDEVIKNHGEDAERLITDLLRRGDVFELKPGRVKVLE